MPYPHRDLTAFRDAVNAGESTAQWEDAGGVVSLLGDIDMKDVKANRKK